MGVKENKEKNGSKKDRNRAAIELRVETKLTVLFSLLYGKKNYIGLFIKKEIRGWFLSHQENINWCKNRTKIARIN